MNAQNRESRVIGLASYTPFHGENGQGHLITYINYEIDYLYIHEGDFYRKPPCYHFPCQCAWPGHRDKREFRDEYPDMRSFLDDEARRFSRKIRRLAVDYLHRDLIERLTDIGYNFPALEEIREICTPYTNNVVRWGRGPEQFIEDVMIPVEWGLGRSSTLMVTAWRRSFGTHDLKYGRINPGESIARLKQKDFPVPCYILGMCRKDKVRSRAQIHGRERMKRFGMMNARTTW